MAAGGRRDGGELSAGLTKWLTHRHPDWEDISVSVTRPQSGLSSETLLVEVTRTGHEHSFVVRLPPSGELPFPDYSLAQQAQVQRALMPTPIPVAEPLKLETDPDFLGCDFLVMPTIEGRLLSAMPAYVAQGWLAESSPEAQTTVLRSFLSTLAEIHRLPVHDLNLGSLSGGGPDLASSMDYWEHFLDWATSDIDGAVIYREALAWCRSHLPAEIPAPSLLWGDPQLVNMVFDDAGRIAAVLDWEMATMGPAEHDLAWFLTLHELGVEMAGGIELPGFPPRSTIIDWYQAALGRRVNDLHWYEVFACIRSGAIVLRLGELMRLAGGSGSWTAHIPQPRQIRRLIGAS